MNTETIHSGFTSIERQRRTYRITTGVKYNIDEDKYMCIAKLFRERNGKVQFENDKYHETVAFTSEKDKVEDMLDDCVVECREKIETIEEKTSLSVSVDVEEG